jgi:alkanesulfonate monooxygenase SsuD/methylene tetrahydromethanopterin reductase-like flavin-dependent oxidoreductase (luciferase family)
VRFSGIQSLPRPVQKPHPPIVIGGMSPQGYRRAVTRARGWYGYALDLDATAASVKALRETEKRHDRPSELGPLEISITPRAKLDRDTVRRFEDLGVHRLIPYRPRLTEEELRAFVGEIGLMAKG